MVVRAETALCPACATPLSRERWSEGLCPGCALELALEDSSLEAEVLLDPEEAPTLQYSGYTFEEGQIQGERYRIRSLLGRGGMGEVWRAYDLKLRQDVALKALRTELIQNSEALETLRQEVRTAREVISPNVCRVFDLQELDGQELVSMEYIDGTTLQELLKQRSPLDLNEAREIASQFLAGLEAIHDAGLVHRDIKPENVMVTRTGRVVVMDFGIAKGLGDGKGGLIAGTPAYMSPEQAKGDELDARADVFSAGVVLAEMVEPTGVGEFEDRRQVWEAIHQATPEIAETPWSRVIGQCVTRDPEARYTTAAELARALEEVTLRAVGDDTAQPYPGLSAFQEEDAEYFFGRELEVEALWKKLRRPHLLAVIGPSGAGKSSFLRAGLLPTLTDGWQAIIATPGNRPFDQLARSLAPQLGDAPGVAGLLQRFHEPDIAVELLSEWRRNHKHALLIVDQFEELFTQNPEAVQASFAELLGRLPLEADVYVLLSMRDDFLLHCQSFESLAPLFSELTPLGPPTGASLRRAVVQPALKCGYRFEDEATVEEMLSEVEGQRGALPLLAFAAAQLWERRDRETGLLTRKSYRQIGGVAGALAQHAEAILDYLGESNAPIVRELFRNLVTAQGTRAARDRTELLSVFAEKGEAKGGQVPFFGVDETQESSAKKKVPVPLLPGNEDSVPLSSAEEVLSSLIDARLLTSYEVPADDDGGGPHQRIEIVHESLLSNWPRLARWQIQDAEGAQLRDELRNQAQLWEQHSRSEDYLWTGTAFREFELWRERYPGALTTTEEDFVRAMRSHADRRRRRRRLALTAVIVVLLAVLSVVTWSRFEAKVEARRAEAANLRSLAQLHLRRSPSEAIAYAIASLENADDPEMRYLALEALWRRPTEFRLPRSSPTSMEFSPDGRWLATADHNGGGTLWPSDGGPPTALENSDVAMEIRISPRGDLVAATMDTERQELGLWSFPGARFLRSFALGDQGATFNFQFSRDGERLLTSTEMPDGVGLVRSWPVEGGEPKLIARLEIPVENAGTFFGVDPTESRLSWPDGRRVRIAQMEGTSVDMSSVASVEHDRAVSALVFDEKGRHLALADSTGTVRIWSVEIDPPRLIRSLRGQGGYAATAYRFDSFGSKLAGAYGLLWDLAAPPDARVLDFGGGAYGLAFDPTGKWLATGAFGTPRLWPLARTYPQVLPGHEEWVWGVSFTPDGKYLVSMSQDGSVRLWPLDSSSDERSRIVYRAEGAFAVPSNFATAPDGSFAVTGNPLGQVLVLPFNGGPVRELAGFADVINRVAVGPKSRLVAAGSGTYIREEGIVRIWDLETDETQILDVGDGERISYLDFTDQGDLLVHSGQKLRRWDLAEDPPRIVAQIELSVPEATGVKVADLSPDGRQVLLVATFGNESRLWLRDLDTGASRELSSRGTDVNTATFDPTGDIIVSGDAQGIRVGLTQGGEPHLLLSSERDMTFVAVSPDGRWIASEANTENNSIRLWPMPDLSQQPVHKLPLDKLLAKLKSLTNLRAVPDDTSSTGWKIEIGPFPGWEEVPTW